jgi:hypothetical protein
MNKYLFFIILLIFILINSKVITNGVNNIIDNLKYISNSTIGYLGYVKNIETYVGNLKVATDLDKKRAAKYAMEQMCKKKGYIWVQGGNEFVYDCKHSKQTCERDSIYPTPDSEDAIPQYYEWRDVNSPEAQEAAKLAEEFSTGRMLSSQMGQSSDITDRDYVLNKDIGGLCILGNEAMRKMCENEGLRYDKSNGKCFTTMEYCYPKQLAFCDGDCFQPPVSYLSQQVFGKTLGRSLARGVGIDSIEMYNALCNKGQFVPNQPMS